MRPASRGGGGSRRRQNCSGQPWEWRQLACKPHLLQLGLLLGPPAQQGVGQGSRCVGRPGAVPCRAAIGPRDQVSQPAHAGSIRAGKGCDQRCRASMCWAGLLPAAFDSLGLAAMNCHRLCEAQRTAKEIKQACPAGRSGEESPPAPFLAHSTHFKHPCQSARAPNHSLNLPQPHLEGSTDSSGRLGPCGPPYRSRQSPCWWLRGRQHEDTTLQQRPALAGAGTCAPARLQRPGAAQRRRAGAGWPAGPSARSPERQQRAGGAR